MLVVDASVVTKWFVDQVHSDLAELVQSSTQPLLAPQLMIAEVADALRKHVRVRDISIEQARVFNQSFGLTGLVVTKLDGTSRGGALVGIYRQLKIPIYFIGLGEQAEDLQPFSVENYAKAVFGLD